MITKIVNVSNSCILKEEETLSKYLLEYTLIKSEIPDKTMIESIVDRIFKDDILCVNVHDIQVGEDYCLYSANKYHEEKLKELREVVESIDQLKIKFVIDKPKNKSALVSVYNLNKLMNFIELKPNFDVLRLFEKRLNDSSINFLIMDQDEVLSQPIRFTKTISFISSTSDSASNYSNREMRIKELSVLGVKYLEKYKIIPEDFHVLVPHESRFMVLINKFGALETLISLLILSTSYKEKMGELQEIAIESRIPRRITFATPIKSNITYFKIYHWIISSNQSFEKLLLSREFLSMNLTQDTIFHINETTINSLLSNFIVYEKKNLETYLKLKDQIVELILKLNAKAELLLSSTIDNILKSVVASIMLYIATILPKFLSSSELYDIKQLLFLLLVFTLIYMGFTNFQSIWKIDMLNKEYLEFKRIHSNLLDEKDMKTLLDEAYFENLSRSLKKKIDILMIVWLLIVLFTLLITMYLAN